MEAVESASILRISGDEKSTSRPAVRKRALRSRNVTDAVFMARTAAGCSFEPPEVRDGVEENEI